jgi:hypothetical protein
MNMDEPKFPVPTDVGHIVLFIGHVSSDLPDMFACEARDLINELIADHKAWKNGSGKEPNWDSFRLSINSMCEDDGMPKLFDDPEICES